MNIPPPYFKCKEYFEILPIAKHVKCKYSVHLKTDNNVTFLVKGGGGEYLFEDPEMRLIFLRFNLGQQLF